MPIWKALETVVNFEKIGNRISGLKEMQTEKLLEEIQNFHKEEALKMQEALEEAKEITFWSILEDMGSIFMGGISTIFGFSALSSGNAVVGGLLISSGIVSISNIAFKHARAWDWLADQVAGKDETLHHAITTYIPSAIGIVAAALGLIGTYGAWQYSTLNSTQQTLAILETVTNLATGMAALANGRASSHYHWARAEVSALQSMAEFSNLDLEDCIEQIKDFNKKLLELEETIGKLVQDTDHAIQITQQTV